MGFTISARGHGTRTRRYKEWICQADTYRRSQPWRRRGYSLSTSAAMWIRTTPIHSTTESVTGYVNFLAEGPVTWQSKTQVSVALSTMEAEYMALAAEVQEVEHHRMVFEELGFSVAQPTVIKEDNKACQLFAETTRGAIRGQNI